MRLAFQIALQFIRRKNSRKPAFTAVMAVIGVAFGVAALLVVITVLNSVEMQLKSILLASNPNLIVYSLSGMPDANAVKASLESKITKPVKRSALFYYNEGLASTRERSATVILRAIQGNASANAEDLHNIIEPSGALAALNDSEAVLANAVPASKPKIILAKGLAMKLGVSQGDSVNLVMTRYGTRGDSRTQEFEVAGLMSVGLNEYDQKLALMNYLDASYFFGKPGMATGIEYRLANPDDAIAVSQEINEQVPYGVRPWQHLDRRLFEQIERDGGIIMIIVFLITFVAAFNIIATLSLGVIDRKRQISLLRSLGATRAFVQQIFLFVGIILGSLGALVGILLAFAILSVFGGLELGELRAFYWLERIPVHYDFKLILVTFVVATLLSFLSSLVPAYTATRVSPLFGLKPGQK